MQESTTFLDLIEELGRDFSQRSKNHDDTDGFVAENFVALRQNKVFSAAIPKELGGAGVSHSEICQALRQLARHCSSTALSLAMHQHLIAAQTWNHLHGKPGKKLLEMVASKQLILISTGANDWLASNGSVQKVAGGYRVTAKKRFASGSPIGDLLMTSAPFLGAEGWQVLHFPVPFTAEGVHCMDDWKTMGMRGTGSNTVSLENVFVPDEAIGFTRPRGTFHPAFWTIVTVACPIIASVYVGVAESAAQIARDQAKSRHSDHSLPYLLGEMENHLATAQLAVDSLVDIANNLDVIPTMEIANKVLIRKTLAVNAALAAGEKALEAFGGGGFYRSVGLERLIRDLHAGQFHPLPEKRQQQFSGRIAMGMEPVDLIEFPQG